jgi:signal transduction histidine kinase
MVLLETSEVSFLIPLWLPGGASTGPLLVLIRRVVTKGKKILQGVLVDWPRLKAMAEKEVRDLFPAAELRPAREGFPRDPGRTLAVLPAELHPGHRPGPAEGPFLTPLRLGLASLWIALLAGTAVVGAGLRSLLALNRRRLDFVSAVTHELRTPLTTFRMYTEMLLEGMVPEEKRPEYLASLFEESGRLSHLVQNVLDYSRLESNHGSSKRETASLEQHLSRALPPLRERCEQKGVPFRLDVASSTETQVALDASALGQILFNLVDNACKYGEGEVRLSVSFEGARALGGDLRLEARDGTRFVLEL